jgi:excinuclease ABC subunit A
MIRSPRHERTCRFAQEVRRALERKMEPGYHGIFSSARRNVLHTFANTQGPLMKRRVSQYMVSSECPLCHGKRLRREALSVKFAGFDIAEISGFPLSRLAGILRPYAKGTAAAMTAHHPEKATVVQRITADMNARITVMPDLGLGYLSLDRGTPTLSSGELQRLRLATQVRSNLFGVVYVLDEPSRRAPSRRHRGAPGSARSIKELQEFAVCGGT